MAVQANDQAAADAKEADPDWVVGAFELDGLPPNWLGDKGDALPSLLELTY